MFLFGRKNTDDESVEKTEEFEEVVSERIFVICIDGKPVLYKKSLEDTMQKVEEIVNGKQFSLTCELKTVFVEWCREEGNVKIYVMNNNCILNYESLESVVSWFELGNE
jgi:hypothetical protein